ncbi:MAG: trypsin-like serine protease, partial [Maritimibacter sp.]|nr:trypsin-like serine protease [Maritimibacter sp.]
MIRTIAVFAALLAVAAPVLGEGTDLKRLVTADESRGWEGVGRLNIGTRSFCTGSLIAENLVLTAGHCLYDPATGQLARPDEIEFLAGWRGGRAAAYRGARRLVVHPGYMADTGQRS